MEIVNKIHLGTIVVVVRAKQPWASSFPPRRITGTTYLCGSLTVL